MLCVPGKLELYLVFGLNSYQLRAQRNETSFEQFDKKISSFATRLIGYHETHLLVRKVAVTCVSKILN